MSIGKVKVKDTGAKASVRHEKIARSKEDELQARKEKVSNGKYALKKMKKEREKEVDKLPKEDRAAAKEKLKAEIAKKEASLKQEQKELVQDLDAKDDADRTAKKAAKAVNKDGSEKKYLSLFGRHKDSNAKQPATSVEQPAEPKQ